MAATKQLTLALCLKTSLVGVRVFQSPHLMNGAVHKRVIERLRAHLVETYSAEFVGSVASANERHVSMSFLVPTAIVASLQNTVSEQKALLKTINDWYTCFLLNPGVRFGEMGRFAPYRHQDTVIIWLQHALFTRILCCGPARIFPLPGYEQVTTLVLENERDCHLYDNTGRTSQLLSVWKQSEGMK